MTKLEEKARAIAAVADKRTGRVSPQDVVEAARDPASPLHNEFAWDDAEAARLHRLDVAKRLIREVKLVITYDSVKVAAPYYVSDPRDPGSSYVPTTKLIGKHAAAKKALLSELERIRGSIARAHAIAATLGLSATFDRMLDNAVEAQRLLDITDSEEAERSSAGQR